MKSKTPHADADLLKQIGITEVRRDRLARLLALQKQVAGLETAIYVATPLDTVSRIACETVTRHYQIPHHRLRGRSREAGIALPRQIVFYIIRNYSNATLEAVGRMFNRDHGTILHGVRAVCARKETDPDFAACLDTIERQCVVALTETRASLAATDAN